MIEVIMKAPIDDGTDDEWNGWEVLHLKPQGMQRCLQVKPEEQNCSSLTFSHIYLPCLVFIVRYFSSPLSNIVRYFPHSCLFSTCLCLIFTAPFLVYYSTQIVQCVSDAVQIWIKRVTTAVHHQGSGFKNAPKKRSACIQKGIYFTALVPRAARTCIQH